MDEVFSKGPSPNGSSKWSGVTIYDPELTSAASFSRLVARATKFLACSAVVMDDLEIVPGVPPEMRPENDRLPILTVDALYDSLRPLTQFVWGFFFFFPNSEAPQKGGGPTELAQRCTGLRAPAATSRS
jgi:hypothetical protein